MKVRLFKHVLAITVAVVSVYTLAPAGLTSVSAGAEEYAVLPLIALSTDDVDSDAAAAEAVEADETNAGAAGKPGSAKGRKSGEGGNSGSNSICWTDAKIELKRTMKRLWMEHLMWTRLYVVSTLSGIDDQEELLARLLKNQQDIGDAVKPYYGEEAGNKLAEMLKEHIQIAGQVVGAAKAGNEQEVKKHIVNWHRNVGEIAAFLAAANPNWSEKELLDMLLMHMDLLTEDVTARLNKDWEDSIAALEKGEAHLIKMADMLSEGIVRQFPDRF